MLRFTAWPSRWRVGFLPQRWTTPGSGGGLEVERLVVVEVDGHGLCGTESEASHHGAGGEFIAGQDGLLFTPGDADLDGLAGDEQGRVADFKERPGGGDVDAACGEVASGNAAADFDGSDRGDPWRPSPLTRLAGRFALDRKAAHVVCIGPAGWAT